MATGKLSSVLANVVSVLHAAGYTRARWSYLPIQDRADADTLLINVFPGGQLTGGVALDRETRGRRLWTYTVTVWVMQALGPRETVDDAQVDAVLQHVEAIAAALQDSYLTTAQANIIDVAIDPIAEPGMLNEENVCASAILLTIEKSEAI